MFPERTKYRPIFGNEVDVKQPTSWWTNYGHDGLIMKQPTSWWTN